MFEIDIDGTIASGAKAFADYYLAQLGLERDEQVLSRIKTYEELMSLPALVAYCRASATNMAHFEVIQKQARHCPEVFERFEYRWAEIESGFLSTRVSLFLRRLTSSP